MNEIVVFLNILMIGIICFTSYEPAKYYVAIILLAYTIGLLKNMI